MKVSVIVPVYNTQQYLEKCLDSLVAQTLDGMEILVINDGSPDGSQEIIHRYEEKYSCVHGYVKENGGLSDARNYGIAKAAGDYIAFVDSDDYVTADMLQKMYCQAKEQDLDIVVCDTFMDYEDHSYILKADAGLTEDPVRSYIMCYPNAPARLIKREILNSISFKKGTWYEDLQLMPRLVFYTDRIGFSNEAFYHYLQHSESIMNGSTISEKHRDIFRVLKDVRDAYKAEGLYEKYHDELEYLHIVHLQKSAIFRFLDLNGSANCIAQTEREMKANFPGWSKNPYFKRSNFKFRLFCILGKYHLYGLLKILKAVH